METSAEGGEQMLPVDGAELVEQILEKVVDHKPQKHSRLEEQVREDQEDHSTNFVRNVLVPERNRYTPREPEEDYDR